MPRCELNRNAQRILTEKVIPNADALCVEVFTLPGGTTVVDMSCGGFVAARHFVEACLGGLGQVHYGKMMLKEHLVPSVRVSLTMPEIAEMSAFVASLRVMWKGQKTTVSGPGRCIRVDPDVDHFAHAVPYTEPEADVAVFCIQTTQIPDEELAQRLSEVTGLRTDKIYIVSAPTGCLVGAVQVCARNVEQAMPTLVDRGFSVKLVEDAYGVTPVVSVVDDEEVAYGRVNDCLIYGQVSTLFVRCEDEEIEGMLEEIPFTKNKDVFGVPFQELFARCGNDWVNVPRDWDAPCRLDFYNRKTGNNFTAGRQNLEVLEKSFMGEGEVLA